MPVMASRTGPTFSTRPSRVRRARTCGLRRLQHAVEAAQHDQRQDDPLVLALLVVAPEQVRDGPDEAAWLLMSAPPACKLRALDWSSGQCARRARPRRGAEAGVSPPILVDDPGPFLHDWHCTRVVHGTTEDLDSGPERLVPGPPRTESGRRAPVRCASVPTVFCCSFPLAGDLASPPVQADREGSRRTSWTWSTINTAEAARRAGVSGDTIRRWARLGYLHPVRVGPGQHYGSMPRSWAAVIDGAAPATAVVRAHPVPQKPAQARAARRRLGGIGVVNGELLTQHAEPSGSRRSPRRSANARGYRSVTAKPSSGGSASARNQARVPPLLIPVWGVTGESGCYRVRPDAPRISREGRQVRDPRRVAMDLDVPPPSARSRLTPTSRCSSPKGSGRGRGGLQGLCAIALLGVWNWRGTNDPGGKVALVGLGDRSPSTTEGSASFSIRMLMTKPEVPAGPDARFTGVLGERDAARPASFGSPLAMTGGRRSAWTSYPAAGHAVEELLALLLSRCPGRRTPRTPRPAAARCDACAHRPAAPGVSSQTSSASFADEVASRRGCR